MPSFTTGLGKARHNLTRKAPSVAVGCSISALNHYLRSTSRFRAIAILLVAAIVLVGCSRFRQEEATRTPFPTFTPTSIGDGVQIPPSAEGQEPPAEPQVMAISTAAATVQPTETVAPTDTPTPAPTETPAPTDTAVPTETSVPTLTPEPTATPDYTFELESAEKFPTESLAPNVVRVYLYVYSPSQFGLAGYSLDVTHNGAALTVDQKSNDGLPAQTRGMPGAYTRFTNMNVIFVETQAGEWTVQLVDEQARAVGPVARFQLTDDENTRELYVRYREK